MSENASDPVERQVDAYNRRDIDAFLSCYASNTAIEDAAGTVVMRGHEAMRSAYRELFLASPNLHAEITTRIRVGAYVIDEEHSPVGVARPRKSASSRSTMSQGT